jgi:hypothetical protein
MAASSDQPPALHIPCERGHSALSGGQLDKDALVLLLEGVKRLTSEKAEEAFEKCREQVASESQERAEPD